MDDPSIVMPCHALTVYTLDIYLAHYICTKVQTLGANIKILAGRGRAKELLRVREALRKRMR